MDGGSGCLSGGQASAQADSVNQDEERTQLGKVNYRAGWRFASQELRQHLVKPEVAERAAQRDVS